MQIFHLPVIVEITAPRRGSSVVLDGGIGFGTNENTVAAKGGITLGW